MPSLNESSWNLVQRAVDRAERLKIHSHQVEGATIVDFGVDVTGGLEAGLALAEICLSGLCTVTLKQMENCPALPALQVHTDHPRHACIGSQYAGWELKVGDFFAMTSGPARCLHENPEEIIVASGIDESSDCAVGIMETRVLPDASVVDHFAAQCGVSKERVAICVAPTASFAGSIQIVARSIETTLHKLHEIGFDLKQVVSAMGSAPIPVFGRDDFAALGWTNDCILYGASATVWVDSDDHELEKIGPQTPSASSRDFGLPFIELFKKYDCDFYKVDKMLFSPAQVTFNNIRTGNSFTFGETRLDILQSSLNLGSDNE